MRLDVDFEEQSMTLDTDFDEVVETGGSGGGIQKETDPTVPDWAKQPTKPTYTADEVGALPKGTKIPSKPEDVGAMPANTKIPSTAADVGALPVPSTASVGQTIRVSAVNESGKPTEWEAVDFPEGGGGASGGIVEIASNADVSAVSSFSYSKDIDGNPLKVNDFWIVLDAPNISKNRNAWTTLSVNGVQLLNIYYYHNQKINLHTVIHKDYCEHTMYISPKYNLSGTYVGQGSQGLDVYRFLGTIGTDLTNAEKTISLKYNYGINDPAWGENAKLWMWGE